MPVKSMPKTDLTQQVCEALNLLTMLCGVSLFWAANVRAEHLPIKTYTTADGLARDSINRIVRDSRGFLWFCTDEGLSLFDGYGFTTYSTNEGLPHRIVNYLLETRNGMYWVATAGGVALFQPTAPKPGPRFSAYSPPALERTEIVQTLFEDRQRRLLGRVLDRHRERALPALSGWPCRAIQDTTWIAAR